MSLTIHCKYKYLDSTVQRAEDIRQKFYFFRLPFAVNVKLNLSISSKRTAEFKMTMGTPTMTEIIDDSCQAQPKRAHGIVMRVKFFSVEIFGEIT